MEKANTVKLLIVDDDPDDRALMKEVINECTEPVQVVDLPDGKYVLNYLNSCPVDLLPDLIILDLNMPLKNGFDVLKEIKGEKKYKSIPIFVLTTSSAENERARATQLGASNFLTKPPRHAEWVNKLCSLIDGMKN